jgi:predicted transcriptional regulator
MNVFEEFFGVSPHKLVRRNDPATSHEAAQAVDSSRLESMVYEAIKKSGKTGIISDDIQAMYPNLPYSSVTARYKSLIDKGFVEIIGQRHGRSGRNQRIMRAK